MPYAFTQDDFRKFQDDIISAGGDQATLTSVLADMQNTFTESMALVETTKTENTSIKDENERLKSANMKLFLQVGEQAKTLQSQGDPPPPEKPISDTPVKDYINNYFSKGGK